VPTTNNKGPDPFYHGAKLTYPPGCFGRPKSLAPGDFLCTRRYATVALTQQCGSACHGTIWRLFGTCVDQCLPLSLPVPCRADDSRSLIRRCALRLFSMLLLLLLPLLLTLCPQDEDIMYDLKAYLRSTDSSVPEQLDRHTASQVSPQLCSVCLVCAFHYYSLLLHPTYPFPPAQTTCRIMTQRKC
jgi:hypothetical protein